MVHRGYKTIHYLFHICAVHIRKSVQQHKHNVLINYKCLLNSPSSFSPPLTVDCNDGGFVLCYDDSVTFTGFVVCGRFISDDRYTLTCFLIIDFPIFTIFCNAIQGKVCCRMISLCSHSTSCLS